MNTICDTVFRIAKIRYFRRQNSFAAYILEQLLCLRACLQCLKVLEQSFGGLLAIKHAIYMYIYIFCIIHASALACWGIIYRYWRHYSKNVQQKSWWQQCGRSGPPLMDHNYIWTSALSTSKASVQHFKWSVRLCYHDNKCHSLVYHCLASSFCSHLPRSKAI